MPAFALPCLTDTLKRVRACARYMARDIARARARVRTRVTVRRAPSARLHAALLALVLVHGGAFAAGEGGSAYGDIQPLPPTEAFVPVATFEGDDTLRLDWRIEDGYYLYRDKVSVVLEEPAGLSLDMLQHSEAVTVSDDWFGEQAVYRTSATTRAALVEAPPGGPGGGEASVAVTFQGCADIGLCYPPTTTWLNLALPARPVAAASPAMSSAPRLFAPSGGSSALDGLFGRDAAASAPELLRPEEAYLPVLLDTTTERVTLDWTIQPGYYLYRDKLSADLIRADGTRVDGLDLLALPDGEQQEDAFFGVTAVLRERATASYAIGSRGPPAGEEATLLLNYQGCADIGVCFPPETIEIDFVATASLAVPVRSEQDRLSGLLAESSLWWSSLTFYGLGLLLAFTPCVLPMVPILSSLIVGQKGGVDGSGGIGGLRALRLSAVYVLVMASTYALAGVLVALSGQNVQVWFQDPILLSAFAALFVLFALAMFGQFELQLPRALQARLTDASNAQRGRGYRGVIVMGFLSTLIVGPCVTAPLVGALLFIADTGNALVGGVALFALGLGMGTPLLLIGTSAGTLLPRAGAWMVRVKQGFGILMLGMAIWMLARFMDPAAIALMAGLLALASGIWLGATDRLDASSGGWPRLGKGAGLALSLYGAAVLAGTLGGGHSLLSPLAVFNGGGGGGAAQGEERELAFQRVATLSELERVVDAASAEGRAVMLDFYADWCISCKEMEAFTFTDERVQALLADVVAVQVDVTSNDAADKALLERFRLFAPPAIVFFDASGNELAAARVVGFLPADRFAEHVQRTLAPAVARR